MISNFVWFYVFNVWLSVWGKEEAKSQTLGIQGLDIFAAKF